MCVGLWFAWGTCTPRVRADETGQLVWSAPAGCPGTERVGALIEHWLGPGWERIYAHSLRIQGRVESQDSDYHMELRIESASGESTENLSASTCDTLAEVAALKASLAVEPEEVLDDVTEPAPHAPPAGEPPHASEPAPVSGAVLGLRAGFESLVGLFPDPTYGVNLSGALTWRHLQIEGGFHATNRQRVSYPGGSSIGVDLQLLAGSVRACLLSPISRVALATCGGATIGAMRGQGRHVAGDRTSRQAWVALPLGAELRYPADSRVGLWLAVDAILQLREVAYHVRNLASLFRTDRTALSASLALDVRLW